MMPERMPDMEDYRKYDRIWRKVSPELDPYPEVRAAQETSLAPRGGEPELAPRVPEGTRCLGGAAQGSLEELRGFLRDALADAQTYRYLASIAPSPEARRLMNRLASDEARRVKTLRAVHFLITGGTYPVTVVLPPQPRLLWRDRLRERWHAEADAAERYRRAAETARDGCLRRVFTELSAESERHAEALQRQIEKTL